MQRGLLNQAVQMRKEYLINQLIEVGYTKTADGRQLYELTLTELEVVYNNIIG
ncbi:Fur-regulated basic protein FbpA [Priestia abyssalis]|uniref:Fur-regulated basic protein FbpA n=1 Tax=Priestia abyssalis TaxID=1221450 RepID=UPI0009958556|nr:Fur-regulated basic protein FbpA [Priestia abyssalis]